MKFNLLKFLSGVAGLFAFGFFCLNGNVAFADDLASTGKTLVGISEYNDVFSENYYNDRVLNNNEEKSSLSFQYPGAHIVRVTFDDSVRALIDDCKNKLENLIKKKDDDVKMEHHDEYVKQVIEVLDDLMNGLEEKQNLLEKYGTFNNFFTAGGKVLLFDKIKDDGVCGEVKWEIEMTDTASKKSMKIERKGKKTITNHADGSKKDENLNGRFSYSFELVSASAK